MNHIMIFDTETTGVPKNYKAPMTDLDNWPRVIQLAWLVADLEANTLKTNEVLIKPDGWEIPKEKFWLDNGFSTEKSLAIGKPLSEVLETFLADMQECEWMVAHNLAFDHPILGSEMLRLGVKSPRKLQRICTMEATINLCKLPFAGQRAYLSKTQKMYKWPKLEELHKHLFGKPFDGAHQAGADVAATKVCLFELVKRGIITLNPAA